MTEPRTEAGKVLRLRLAHLDVDREVVDAIVAIEDEVSTTRPAWLPRDLIGAAFQWAAESKDDSPAAIRLRKSLVSAEPLPSKENQR